MATPPVGPAVRSLWPRLVTGEASEALYAVDSTLQELTFVVGPALVALTATLAGPAAPLIASAGFGLLGAVAMALHPAVASSDVRAGRGPGEGGQRAVPRVGSDRPFARPRLWRPPDRRGGLCHGPRRSGSVRAAARRLERRLHRRRPNGGHRVNAAAEARAGPGCSCVRCTGALVLLVAPNVVLLYPLIFVAGLSLVPALGSLYNLAGKMAPPTGGVEAFGWLASGTQTGIAGGSALGGVVLQHFGATSTFVVAAASIFASAAVVLVSRDSLARAREAAGVKAAANRALRQQP